MNKILNLMFHLLFYLHPKIYKTRFGVFHNIIPPLILGSVKNYPEFFLK